MGQEARQAGEIGRAGERTVARQQLRAAERREPHRQQRMGLEAGPAAAAAADADIVVLAAEVHVARRDLQAHRDIGMRHLEGAHARHQPVGGEGVHGGDRQHALGRVAQGGKAGMQSLERLGHRWRQPPAGLRQHHPPRLPQEQWRPDPVLQQLHLVADGGLGHPQFLRGLGETLMAGRRLEGANGREGRQLRRRHP